ncbi:MULTISPECIES: M16 family metallopeptidase [Prochlorococcus]|uniref:M16 family metallopeptidase n=1 Tax=Prochlorococcus TaxID=1218 RepID=UPI0005339CB7|nr:MULTISPECIES: pitrilysin family protein [Prochlorococcus]KGG12326.1 Insulinase family (Peptidase family M16) [Prochlorococcus sp. MIT 0601]
MSPVQLLLDPRNTTGILAGKLWIREGSRADPYSKKGLHQILGGVINRGCGPYNHIEVADLIEGSGAELRCDTFEDGLLISLKCAAKDHSTILPLLGWMITSPILETSQINIERELSIQGLKRQNESPFHLAFNSWRELVYKGSVYGHDPLGSIDNIALINRDDIVGKAKKLPSSEKTLILSGSIPESYIDDISTIGKINLLTNGASNVSERQNEIEKFKQEEDKQTIVLTKQDISQVVLILGTKTIAHSHNDDLLLRLLSCYLGSGMSSLLFRKLREEYGVAYDVGVYHPIREYNAPFIVHASTTKEKANKSFELLISCWRSLMENELSEDDMHLIRAKFKGNMAQNSQTISQRAERKAQLMGFKMRVDYDETCIDRINSITSKEINQIANRYLQKPKLSICGHQNSLNKIQSQWLHKPF